MYSCTCVESETSDVFVLTMRTARKTHVCCECGCKITRGEKYEHVDELFHGCWYHCATCRVCSEIASTMQACGRVLGVLWEGVHEANCRGDKLDGSDDFCICPVTENLRNPKPGPGVASSAAGFPPGPGCL